MVFRLRHELWSCSENPTYTTALSRTEANISKYTCGFSDFPMPGNESIWKTMSSTLTSTRTSSLTQRSRLWPGTRTIPSGVSSSQNQGPVEVQEFGKAALCHGYQTKAVLQAWLHKAAGMGMENLSWGWRGRKFRRQGPKMYRLTFLIIRFTP
ncbi:hypothetical protein GGTG_09816 [Gaeumannomyces tritici R3-111a-1]|uniref:Uncharacterized protein n=1 Tax=Gaeumannomyces tritici (strain R3-111a-1) TaxID=644352 RepID=J3P8I2_GAET3|nr:hypothetical protein GGTG_09816 [Gaeumannomyces tritici R3-111a-1]EJT72965.1 hypothetical protein GGTG_09816 [Gaeumannomyces tritici R3-111a-1]